MTWGEALAYIAVGNPVSQALLTSASAVLKGTGIKSKQVDNSFVLSPPKAVTMLDLTAKNYHFVRLAGVFGMTAVIMGAYGNHRLAKMQDILELSEAKALFETAHRFHFLHSFALLGMPLGRRPALTGSLMAAGCLLFCVPMYYRALTGDKTFKQVATYGGFCLIAAWASLIF